MGESWAADNFTANKSHGSIPGGRLPTLSFGRHQANGRIRHATSLLRPLARRSCRALVSRGGSRAAMWNQPPGPGVPRGQRPAVATRYTLQGKGWTPVAPAATHPARFPGFGEDAPLDLPALGPGTTAGLVSPVPRPDHGGLHRCSGGGAQLRPPGPADRALDDHRPGHGRGVVDVPQHGRPVGGTAPAVRETGARTCARPARAPTPGIRLR